MIHSALIGMAFLVQEPPPVEPVPVPTWHGSVSQLVQSKCGNCHAPDSVAPFSLLEYAQVKRRASFIRHVVEEDLMPPWLPSGGVVLRHSLDLTSIERTRLLAWLDAEAPEGVLPEEPSDSKQTVMVTNAGESLVTSDSEPTLHRAAMRGSWDMPAEGGRRWFKAERDKRTFVLPLDNPVPLRVQSIDYRTSAPVALAATALSADGTGVARRMVDRDEEQGSYMMGDIGFVAAGSLGVVGPGGGRLQIPQGFHLDIPRMADLVSEVHFRPQGRPWILDDEIVIEEVPSGSSSRPLVPLNVMVRKIELEAGETARFESDIVLPTAVDLVAMTPRASRRCTSLTMTALAPESEHSVLLFAVDDWNPHYRSTYVLDEPLRLAAGTRVSVIWNYDNSEANDRNPVVPPEAVSLGGRVGMANMLLMCSPADEIDAQMLRKFAASEVRRRQR
jgi:hypothetical protein